MCISPMSIEPIVFPDNKMGIMLWKDIGTVFLLINGIEVSLLASYLGLGYDDDNKRL
jgi:hypothetical protein